MVHLEPDGLSSNSGSVACHTHDNKESLRLCEPRHLHGEMWLQRNRSAHPGGVVGSNQKRRLRAGVRICTHMSSSYWPQNSSVFLSYFFWVWLTSSVNLILEPGISLGSGREGGRTIYGLMPTLLSHRDRQPPVPASRMVAAGPRRVVPVTAPLQGVCIASHCHAR